MPEETAGTEAETGARGAAMGFGSGREAAAGFAGTGNARLFAGAGNWAEVFGGGVSGGAAGALGGG